jgi:hypothetical protein
VDSGLHHSLFSTEKKRVREWERLKADKIWYSNNKRWNSILHLISDWNHKYILCSLLTSKTSLITEFGSIDGQSQNYIKKKTSRTFRHLGKIDQ